MKKVAILILFMLGCAISEGYAQKVALKSNLLYDAPCDPIIQRYMDGGAKKQFQFAFTSQEEYDQDARINIENSGFFQSFEEWLEQQSFNDNLPELGEKKNPISIETLNSGYLYDMNGENAKYRIECRLIYTQEV